MVALNIGELAKEVGLRTSAIRFYESVGLLQPPPRQSGWRRYDAVVLDRLKVIQVARQMGFSLAEIKVLLDGFPKGASPSKRWRSLAKKKLPEIEAAIQRAVALKYLIEGGMDCTCEDLALCINSHGKACHPADLKPVVALKHDCGDPNCTCEN
ncbi:MAG: MerR family transcriptional regulator [Chloroflexi bacterium]|nr:MerR family transcriptional regulator [Chloroflexota bacterium]